MTQRWAPCAALVWIWLSLQLAAASVSAQDAVARGPDMSTRAVVLDSSHCGSVARDELRELVALELAPRPVQSPREVPADASITRAELTCSETRARLFVRDAARQQQHELGLDLAQIDPPARARLIALALAELIATVDMEPVSAPERADETAAPEPSAALRLGRSSWWLGAGLSRAGRPRVLAPSLQTGVVARLARLPLALLSDLQLQRGARTVGPGRMVVWTTSGSLGLAGMLRAGPAELALGLGMRLGYARLVGEAGAADVSIAAHTVQGLWWGPSSAVSALLPLHGRFSLRAGLDIGWIARGVRGLDNGGMAAFRLEGLLLQATLGVSLALPHARAAHPDAMRY